MARFLGVDEFDLSKIDGTAKTSLSSVYEMTLHAGTVLLRESFDTQPAGTPGTAGNLYNMGGALFGYSDNRYYPIHDSTGGWNGTGASKIPIFGLTGDQENFSTYWNSTSINNTTAYYLRACWKVSSNFPHDPGANWKLSYNVPQADATRTVVWMRPFTSDGFQPAITNGGENVFRTEGGVDDFFVRDWKNQWYCIEWYLNILTDEAKLWITTRDGTYNDTLYIDTTDVPLGGTLNSYFEIGSYWDGAEYEDTYFWLDDIVVSSEKIGPPTGFVTG